MVRHPTARRVHRQETAPDDAFVAGVLEGSVWIRDNARLLVAAGLAVVLAVLGVLYYRSYTANLRDRAAQEILAIRQAADAGNPALAIRDTELFLANYGRTPSAREARLILGRLHLEAGQYQEAINAVQPLAGNLREPMGTAAAFLTAAAHEAATRYDDADRTYLRIAEGARHRFDQERALDAAARLRLERDDPAGAAALYERLLRLLPDNAPERSIFEFRLAEAQAAAAAQRTP
jgi:predicted negative regulator of RcsB-dependent stress response